MSKLHVLHEIQLSSWALQNKVLCSGLVMSYTAEYTKAKEMGSFLSRDLHTQSDCQECVFNACPTHFIFQFPEIFLTSLQTQNTYVFPKTAKS